MKTVLTNPPWKGKGWYGVRAGSRWPFTTQYNPDFPRGVHYLPFPFFLAYAAALLEREKEGVLLIDAVAEDLSDAAFLKRVCDFRPGLSLQETSTASFVTDIRTAKRIKERSGARVALCGPHVSVFPRQILRENPWVDFALIGEYEYTLLDLVRALPSGKGLGKIAGLAWRDRGGRVRVNGRRPAIENLDALPWPHRRTLPMERYIDAFCGMPQPMLQVMSSRGCPYRCIFCMWPDVMYGDHKYRVRDPKDVVDEIEHCLRTYNIKSFYFDDDTFNIGKKRVLRIAREIGKRDFGVPWACMARADTMDEEMLRAMADAGLIAVKYGVESASQDILDRSGKGLDLQKVGKTIAFTRKLGIRYHLTFTFGLPGETRDTIRRTIEWAKELNPTSVQFSITTPFPGTAYYEEMKEKGNLLAKSWKEYDGSGRSVIRTESLSREDLESACARAYGEWAEHERKRRTPGVTVYVPCFNAEKTLAECLRAIKAQTYPVDEVLVVDDGSKDRTEEIARALGARVLAQGRNLGLSAARNRAVKEARNGLVAAVDADCVPAPDWLDRLMRNFEDPEVAGVCGKLIESRQDSLADRWRAIHMPQHWGSERIVNPYFLFGADHAYRKNVLLEVGLFDERHRTNFEDVDLGIRLARSGKKTVYDPSAVVQHLKTDTIRSVLRAYYRWYSPNYPEPFSAKALSHRIRVYFGDLLRMTGEDLRAGRHVFLGMDVLLWLHRSILDLKRFINRI